MFDGHLASVVAYEPNAQYEQLGRNITEDSYPEPVWRSGFDLEKNRYDLVTSSYMLDRMTPAQMEGALENMWQAANDVIVLIEAPQKGKNNILLEAREYFIKRGAQTKSNFEIVAPVCILPLFSLCSLCSLCFICISSHSLSVSLVCLSFFASLYTSTTHILPITDTHTYIHTVRSQEKVPRCRHQDRLLLWSVCSSCEFSPPHQDEETKDETSNWR